MKRKKTYTFGGFGIVSEVSVEPGVFSSFVEFVVFAVSELEGLSVFDESVLFSRLEVSDEFVSFDVFAEVSQVFCTTAYCV